MKRVADVLMPAQPGFLHAAVLIFALLALRLGAYSLVVAAPGSLPHAVCQQDCLWYMRLAQAGYEVSPQTAPSIDYAMANWAFFPAFPVLVAGLEALAHWPFEFCGMIVANLSFVGFVFMGVRYLADMRPGTNQGVAILFLMAFPFGFYFSIPYTESLYAFLTVSVLWAIKRGRPGVAGLWLIPLLVTRVTGVLLWPTLAWMDLTPALRAWQGGDRRGALSRAFGAMLPLAIAPLGLTLFMAYLYTHVGDALAFDHVQVAWHRQFQNPFMALLRGFLVFDVKDAIVLAASSQWLYAMSGILGLALSTRLVRIGCYREAWFLGATILLAASEGGQSMQRFVWANPVALLFLCDWLWAGRARRFMPGLLLGFAVIQLYFVHVWSADYAGLD